MNVNVLIVDYRSFGRSKGRPSEQGLYTDAAATLEYALSRPDVINPNLMYAYGTSLGGAVVIQLAEAKGHHFRGVIIENTFKSLATVIDDKQPFYSAVRPLVLSMTMNSYSRVQNISQPCLFLIGKLDDVVPNSHMEELYSNASSCQFKKRYLFKDGDHTDMWADMPYEFKS